MKKLFFTAVFSSSDAIRSVFYSNGIRYVYYSQIGLLTLIMIICCGRQLGRDNVKKAAWIGLNIALITCITAVSNNRLTVWRENSVEVAWMTAEICMITTGICLCISGKSDTSVLVAYFLLFTNVATFIGTSIGMIAGENYVSLSSGVTFGLTSLLTSVGFYYKGLLTCEPTPAIEEQLLPAPNV